MNQEELNELLSAIMPVWLKEQRQREQDEVEAWRINEEMERSEVNDNE